MLKKIKYGFSLMEMMIVLLIISIIAAATAPMITKKMTRGAGTGDSPWVFTGDRNSIGYLSKNGQVLIGASKVPEDAKQSKLYIAGAQDWSHIRFGNSNNSSSLGITANPGTSTDDSAIGISNVNIPSGSVMFGMGQTIGASTTKSVAIGNEVEINGVQATAIGRKANATISDSTAIGGEASATGEFSTAAGVRSVASAQCATAYGDTAHATETNATAIGTWSTATQENATAVGYKSNAEGVNSVALGYDSDATGQYSTALGYGSMAKAKYSNALGYSSTASKDYSTALGYYSTATGVSSSAVGRIAVASGASSSAFGHNSTATHASSTAIGYAATTTASNQVVLGNSAATVYIPGNLVVGGSTYLGVDKTIDKKYRSNVYINFRVSGGKRLSRICEHDGDNNDLYRLDSDAEFEYSDRRLKNVGEKYIAGLEELKKLDFFHYTFKKDDEKTPHVGVIAQDLQKVFPDAVTKSEDGYLRIRMEDMFYAVINAVKELDLKITSIIEKVDNLVKNVTEMKSTIENQQYEINNLKAQNKEIIEVNQELVKRIEKLEKNTSKKD